MGTKRPFDEDLQEFIKHPKHLEHGNKHVPFEEYKHSLEPCHNLPITGEDHATFFQTIKPEKVNSVSEMVNEFETSGPVFPSNIFPEFFEFNMPRRQLVHHDDTYSSLLNNSPRKQVPIGPDHQADVPDLDPHFTKTLTLADNQGKGTIVNSPSNDSPECKCLDFGSIRCVQQHINEVRLNLKNSLGLEKFTELGLHEMGEQVSDKWTDEEQQLFQDVIYSNPASLGRRFWDQLSIAFNSRSKKELVSYYFNVFMLRRRAVQNRSNLLEIDSDDDEWWGSKRGPTSPEQEFVVVGPIGEDEDLHEERERERERVREEEEKVNVRSESYLHWDPPYSTMGLTKGVDLLPTCSMIEEIFGSSKNGKTS